MNRFAAAAARLLTGTAAPAAPAADGGKGGATDTVTLTRAQADELEAEAAADVTAAEGRGKEAGIAEGKKLGFDDANARYKAVLESEPGKANLQGALTLLGNPKLDAQEIIAMLPGVGAPAGAKGTGKVGADGKTHLDQTALLEVAPIDHDNDAGEAGGKDGGGKGSGKGTWGKVQTAHRARAAAGQSGAMRGAVQPHAN